MGAGKVQNNDFDLYVNPYRKVRRYFTWTAAGSPIDLIEGLAVYDAMVPPNLLVPEGMGGAATGIMSSVESTVYLRFRGDSVNSELVPVLLFAGEIYHFDITRIGQDPIPSGVAPVIWTFGG